jgi:type II secretory pathway component PulF
LVKYHYKSKKTLHIILLKTPVIKSILSCFNIAFITEHLSLMVSSGSDVVSSIKVIEDTLPNLVFREQLNKIRNLIVGGKKLKDAFKQANLFPPFVTRMIGVGEETGALSSQLDYVSGEYRHRLNGLVATIGKTIEPIALFVGGAMFIILIIGLFMPLYDVIGSIGQ